MIRLTRPAVAGMLLAVALAACKGNKEQYSSGAIDTAKALTTPDSAAAASTAAPVMVAWLGPTVIGFAETANAGEVTLGRLAEKKATNPDVKAYARLMVTDHSAMLAETKKLAAKVHIAADTTVQQVRDLMSQAADAMQELTAKPASADWDKNYMDKMVAGHQMVLGRLQEAARTTTDADVKQALETAIGKVQTHLTRAQDVRAKLS
jgi:putative membrane protein